MEEAPKLAEYEYTSGGFTHTAQLTEDEAEVLGAKKIGEHRYGAAVTPGPADQDAVDGPLTSSKARGAKNK